MDNIAHLTHNPVFWITISFILVVGLIVKKIVPAVINGLDNRSANINEEIERATALREEAQAILAKYQKKQRESLKEAEEIVQKANLEARRITKEAEQAVEVALKKRMKLAVEKIEQAERQALQEVQAKVIDITMAATRAIIAEKLTPAARDALVESAAQDLQEKLH